jgi:hypothetical protein
MPDALADHPEDAVPPAPGDTRPPFSWQGAVAIALSLGIFIVIGTICVAESIKLAQGLPLSGPGINFLTATLSGLVGAVATFLGRAGNGPPPDLRQPPQTKERQGTPP